MNNITKAGILAVAVSILIVFFIFAAPSIVHAAEKVQQGNMRTIVIQLHWVTWQSDGLTIVDEHGGVWHFILHDYSRVPNHLSLGSEYKVTYQEDSGKYNLRSVELV